MQEIVEKALATLQTVFGFDAFRPGQAEVVQRLLIDQSALAVFPTGQGKSLCYQLPALHFSGLTLVISPLIALMKDQVEFLQARNIKAARLDSSLSGEEIRQIYDDLRRRQQKILFVAPERLSNERFLQTLHGQVVDLLVIDEAHCISEWGHNFRPDYLKLATLAVGLKVKRVLALTATATPKVADDICREFHIAPEAYIHTGFYRPNLTLHFSVCQEEADKRRKLLQQLKQAPAGPTIVYVTLQKTAETVAALLSQAGYDSRAYHAGMQTEVRNAVQDWFMASNSAIVVATIAFGMGIDKADIRYVYHYNLPKTIENYSQEIGRAGRDGRPARCEVLAAAEDIIVLENFIYGDTPDQQALTEFVAFILAQETEFDISVYELANQFDIRALVVRTALTYLELMGVIESTVPFYHEYRFQPNHPSAQILAKFDETRTAFLRDLFRQAKKRRTWFSLDVTAAAETLQTPRERIVRALNYLEEQGDLTLSVTGARQGYRLVSHPSNPQALHTALNDRFIDSERKNIERLEAMMALVSHAGCRARALLAYFGETKADDCGHCEGCLQSSTMIYQRPPTTITPTDQAMMRQVQQETSLITSRQVARFLCGIISPHITKHRLKNRPEFGALAHIPFATVLKAVEEIN